MPWSKSPFLPLLLTYYIQLRFTASYVYITTLEYHISLLKSLLASCLYLNSFRKNIFILPCLERIALALRAAYTSIHCRRLVFSSCLTRFAIYHCELFLSKFMVEPMYYFALLITYCCIALRAISILIHCPTNVFILPCL